MWRPWSGPLNMLGGLGGPCTGGKETAEPLRAAIDIDQLIPGT